MIYFTDNEIDALITEDAPFNDLTTSMLKLGSQPAKIQFSTRHDTVVCGTEEVLKIFSKFNIKPTLFTQSGESIEKDVKFLEAEGLAKHIHIIWRASANLMEFASGIATRTNTLVEKVKEISPTIEIATTRKTIPYTRKIATKAVRAGGGGVHRLGLSESILIYDNHYKFVGGLNGLKSKLEALRKKLPGNNIVIEVKSSEDANTLVDADFDILQFDKLEPNVVKEIIPILRKKNPKLKYAISGGLREDNILEYAGCGADILVTSWPYFAHPADFSINIEPIYDFDY